MKKLFGPKQPTLREQAALFVFDNSPDAYFMTQLGEIVECNDALAQLMATSKENLIGLDIKKLSPKHQPCGRLSGEKIMENLKNVGTRPIRFEWTHQRLDGTPLPVLVTIIPAPFGGKDARINFWQDMRETVALRAGQEKAKQAEQEAHRTQKDAVDQLAAALLGLSQGDLTRRIGDGFPSSYEQLKLDFNSAVGALETTIVAVKQLISKVSARADTISESAENLARRNERTVATIEETNAALVEMTSGIQNTAERASKAAKVTAGAHEEAATSELVIAEAKVAMSQIEESSRAISQIIGMIDEIAFQTNLLALNAGVEAARAGDSGRGFAVVAQEVRGLAQRSAEAARNIKALITASAVQVGKGVSLVDQTGATLLNISSEVRAVSALVNEMASLTREQSSGLREIMTAVGEIDRATQENSSLVDNSHEANKRLTDDAHELARLVDRFQVTANAPAKPRARAPAFRAA